MPSVEIAAGDSRASWGATTARSSGSPSLGRLGPLCHRRSPTPGPAVACPRGRRRPPAQGNQRRVRPPPAPMSPSLAHLGAHHHSPSGSLSPARPREPVPLARPPRYRRRLHASGEPQPPLKNLTTGSPGCFYRHPDLVRLKAPLDQDLL